LHVTGGALRGGRAVEGEAAIAGNLLVFNLITIIHVHTYVCTCVCMYVLYTSFRKSYMSFVLLVLDTAAGVWLDRNGLVTTSRTSKGHAEYDSSLELMRRCRHAAASVGVRIYIYGGLKGGKTLTTLFRI
jgi:protein phosphatase